MKVIVCGYKCEDYISRCRSSLEMQTFRDFEVIWIFDEDDRTGSRKYLVENTVEGIHYANPMSNEVVALLDADDFLCDEYALEIIAEQYDKDPDLLLTYGSYVNLSNNKTGKFCKPYQPGENFRTSDWRGTHLKTFRHRLFKVLPDKELRDHHGSYYTCCADRAMMLPMMEMAGHKRIKHIDWNLYCYNDMNPQGVWKTRREESKRIRQLIHSRPPLNRRDDI